MDNQNKKEQKWVSFLLGVAGGLLVVLLVIAALVFLRPFNYQPLLILNTSADSLLNCQKASIANLRTANIILTPQEYTSQLSNFYNTLVAFLIGLFVIFTLINVWYIKKMSHFEIENLEGNLKNKLSQELKDSIEDSFSFTDRLTTKITSQVNDDLINSFHETIDQINDKTEKLEKKINDLLDEQKNTTNSVIDK